MGYRVQVFSSGNVDEAMQRKANFEKSADGIDVDVVFDPPYYKVRLGNFVTRKRAEQCRDSLRAAGVSEAWVVRDRVTITR